MGFKLGLLKKASRYCNDSVKRLVLYCGGLGCTLQCQYFIWSVFHRVLSVLHVQFPGDNPKVMAQVLDSTTHPGDTNGVPGSVAWLNLLMSILGLDQQPEDPNVFICLCCSLPLSFK